MEKVIIPLENVCLIYKFPLLKSFEASPSFRDIVTGCVEYLKHDIHSVVCMKKKLIIHKTNFFLRASVVVITGVLCALMNNNSLLNVL